MATRDFRVRPRSGWAGSWDSRFPRQFSFHCWIYIGTGSRIDFHAEGFEERPPEGLEALPAIVRPDIYGGQTRANSPRTVSSALIESSSSA